jgi:hypothetical protein
MRMFQTAIGSTLTSQEPEVEALLGAPLSHQEVIARLPAALVEVVAPSTRH